MSKPIERPIVLTAQEVNAVLAGDKTQHRVPIKMRYGSLEFLGSRDCNKSDPSLWGWDNFEDSETRVLSNEPCPFGAEGDRLWVQEPTLAIEDVGWIGPVFVASDNGRNAIGWGYGPYDDPAHIPACELTYNKPDDLSYEDSRLLLEITDIRIERVQDITAMNAQAEGSPLPKISTTYFDLPFHQACCNLLEWFKDYWFARHSAKSWIRNDWVWVIEFKVIKENNDD